MDDRNRSSSKLLDRISICRKIIGIFSLVLCATVGLGAFSLQRLDAVNLAAADLRNYWLPATSALDTMAEASQRFRSAQAGVLLTISEERRRASRGVMADELARFDAAHAAYERMATPGEERQKADAFTAAWREYLALSKTFDAMVNAGDMAHATAFYSNDLSNALKTMCGTLEADVGFNLKGGQQAADHGAALARSAHRWILIVLGAMAALCIGIGWSMVRGISTPIGGMTEAMRRVAGGDMATPNPGTDRGDEIGGMAGAVQVFKDNMIRAAELSSAEEARAATERRAGRLDDLLRGFETKIGSLVGVLSNASAELEATAQSMSSTATQTNDRALAVTSAAEQANAGAQTVAAAAEELTASIGEISRQVVRSSRITEQAVNGARRSDTVVRALADSAQKIGDVVVLINNIEYRETNQPAGAERHHQGRACQRCRQGLRRGGLRSEKPGAADRQGDRGNRHSNRPDPGGHRRGGAGDHRHHRDYRRGERDHHHHRLRRGTARGGDCRDCAQCAANRGQHAGGDREYRRRQPGCQ
ncbi:MAG TPA: methyl-accepting chemotaxis protein [Acetobacteraceae bacterium]|jgi:methyl-accepting chemotaxis protein